MATAFLFHQEHVLMMKKARSKLFDFEFWGGIGGHLEPEELNFPMKASFREIQEETGFTKQEIEHFTLRYILIEQSGGEIRQQYVYFGDTLHRNVVPSDEGELFWIPKQELASLKTSTAIRCALQHYLDNSLRNCIHVGAVAANNEPSSRIQWSAVTPTSMF
ncbi:MAG: NUDIX domain-containing protein [Paenibacillaceae bacterium]|nr:NUDIX domain-containing protein [Paenibacillaceae bacterium]